MQWTSTGCLIAVAGLLVVAGRLGDLYGHGRLFTVGVLGFGASSAGIGLAPGIGWVLALRVAQGVFGAAAAARHAGDAAGGAAGRGRPARSADTGSDRSLITQVAGDRRR